MRLFLFFLMMGIPLSSFGEVLSLNDALRATYTACVGIDDELSDLKTMAGINTAITSVGTVAGAGATATGFMKANNDKKLQEIIERIRKKEENLLGKATYSKQADWEAFFARFDNLTDADKENLNSWKSEQEKLKDKSKKLGNWRTGLLATGAATNIAGAVIAGTNKVDADLKTQISDCVKSVSSLRDSVVQARINGEDVSEAETIISACGEYEYVDVSKINKRAKGAMISSSIGAATGVTGTAVSAVANTDKNAENAAKEKKLNTAANVMSVGSTATSAVATIMNATQIAAIKKVANVSEKCTGVLK
ncbi:MAG: hypothetical protein IKW67_00875 [Alphaproteobacteria bacterium]|nr:hypothetical protein [Alphaproteobacteria bacterium]